MWPLTVLVFFVLGILSLRGVRWAYVTFVVLGLLYFPVSVGFRLDPRACQLAIDLPLALFSLTNYAHMGLFALFFVITSAQLRMVTQSALVRAGLATLVMGALVEIAQGITGNGNCRLRDLVPDSAGAFLGTAIVFLWNKTRTLPRSGQHESPA